MTTSLLEITNEYQQWPTFRNSCNWITMGRRGCLFEVPLQGVEPYDFVQTIVKQAWFEGLRYCDTFELRCRTLTTFERLRAVHTNVMSLHSL